MTRAGLDRRQWLAGSLGLGLLGGLGCARRLALDPSQAGRPGGPFGAWSLIAPRAALFGAARFDVVVIGSGYGGAVTAARLAGPGRTVAILERGQEWLPGDFPESLDALVGSERAVDPMGLLDLYTPPDSDLDLVMGSGVGGTSLINAAISTRPVDAVFAQPEWPRAVREAHARGELDRYYDLASAVLEPHPYDGEAPIKVALHRRLAAQRGAVANLLPLNVRYRDVTRRFGARVIPQRACTLCGNCTTGCNVGAKSTLQTNYLPIAVAGGARIFAGIEVERIERRRDGYRVHYAARSRAGSEARHVDAGEVIVAAGSLGSTALLMASRDLGLSRALGTRVSANGDLLGLCYNGANLTNGIAEPVAEVRRAVGNGLMGYVDDRGRSARLEDQFLLLEAAIPAAVANAVAKGLATYGLATLASFGDDQRARILRDLLDPTAPDPHGALAHSTLYLACGHDDSGGRYVEVPGERPRIVWPGVTASRFTTTITAEMQAYTALQGGHFIANPRTTLFGGRLMVPHPLGGCPMGDDAATGVVDDLGRVFDGRGGVHDGLYVLDGSVIPRSLGCTPLLTIAALAERAATAIAARR